MSFSYCAFVLTEKAHPLHREYHDNEYGFFTDDEARLFERLVLEIFQAGLSWETILKKREGFWRAFEGFDVDKVAAYGEPEIERLLGDAGIIRNRLKINAAIYNAQQIQALRNEHGSFTAWLQSNNALDLNGWVKLFKKTFKFTGGEIVNSFLMSLGYLPGAHDEDCPVLAQARATHPKA